MDCLCSQKGEFRKYAMPIYRYVMVQSNESNEKEGWQKLPQKRLPSIIENGFGVSNSR